MFLIDFLHQVYVPSRIEMSAGAVRELRISIGRLEAWAGRQLLVADFSEDLLRRFLTEYRQSHAPATTNSKRSQLLALWRCAFEEGLLPAPPRAKAIRRAREAPAIPEAWTAAEVGRILSAAQQTQGDVDGLPFPWFWRALILVCYDSAERIGAVLAATPADISLAGGWIVFRRTKQGRPRWSALHADTIAACRLVLVPNSPRLFHWPHTRKWLNQLFCRILKSSGVAYGRARGGVFHKLRRTAGTLVEQNGGDGAAFIGDSRAVFLNHYRDPRFFRSQLAALPRPV